MFSLEEKYAELLIRDLRYQGTNGDVLFILTKQFDVWGFSFEFREVEYVEPLIEEVQWRVL